MLAQSCASVPPDPTEYPNSNHTDLVRLKTCVETLKLLTAAPMLLTPLQLQQKYLHLALQLQAQAALVYLQGLHVVHQWSLQFVLSLHALYQVLVLSQAPAKHRQIQVHAILLLNVPVLCRSQRYPRIVKVRVVSCSIFKVTGFTSNIFYSFKRL